MARRMPTTAFGVAVAALGVAVVMASQYIKTGFTYDVVGPALFSTLIGAGLTLSGIATVVSAARSCGDASQPRLRLWPVALISIALLFETASISRLGWIPAVAIVFLAGTYAFGDRRVILNAAIGVALASFVLVAFAFGLGIDLPLGPLEPLLQRFQ
jgi:putative tricarboxylic transport membrane protein